MELKAGALRAPSTVLVHVGASIPVPLTHETLVRPVSRGDAGLDGGLLGRVNARGMSRPCIAADRRFLRMSRWHWRGNNVRTEFEDRSVSMVRDEEKVHCRQRPSSLPQTFLPTGLESGPHLAEHQQMEETQKSSSVPLPSRAARPLRPRQAARLPGEWTP